MEILTPPESITGNFEGKVRPIFQQIESLLKQNRNLVQTRDRLLPRLISGKLSVENLDIHFPLSMAENGEGVIVDDRRTQKAGKYVKRAAT